MTQGAIRALVDGQIRQSSDLARMIWPITEILAHLSRLVALAPGDLIFTGTPAGVGAVTPGQQVTVAIDGLRPLTTQILPGA